MRKKMMRGRRESPGKGQGMKKEVTLGELKDLCRAAAPDEIISVTFKEEEPENERETKVPAEGSRDPA